MSTFSLLVACALAAPWMAAQDATPAPAPVPQEQPDPAAEETTTTTVELTTDAGGVKLVPGTLSGGNTLAIRDIRAHRIRELPYVRSADQVVRLGLPPIDLGADPVLVVDGREVSRAELLRRLVMLAAENERDRVLTQRLVQLEIGRQVASGADAAAYVVSEEDIDRKLQDTYDMLELQGQQAAQQDPSVDAAVATQQAIAAFNASIEASMGMVAYREQLATEALFERVFLPRPPETTPEEKAAAEAAAEAAAAEPDFKPGKPAWLPQTTWDALGTNTQGQNLRDWVIAGDTEMPSFFRAKILAEIKNGLILKEGLQYFFEADMPVDQLCRLGDQPVMVSEVWPLIEAKVQDVDIEMAVRELLMLEAMKQDLESKTVEFTESRPVEGGAPGEMEQVKVQVSAWMDPVRFAQAYVDHNKLYEGTIFPLQTMILFRGYTSLDRYREHYRYRESYARWRKQTLTDEEVLDHFQTGGRLFFERGNAVVEVAFNPLGARPFTRASFEEVGREMEAYFASVTPEASTGDLAADKFRALTARFPPPAYKNTEDTGAFQRAPLRMRLAESELSMFLTGYCLTDDLFYLGEPGDVFGPWPQTCRFHAWGAEQNAGAWMVRVVDFNKRQSLGNFDGREKELAYEDFVDLNYFDWAQAGLAGLLPRVQVKS